MLIFEWSEEKFMPDSDNFVVFSLDDYESVSFEQAVGNEIFLHINGEDVITIFADDVMVSAELMYDWQLLFFSF